MQRNTMAIEQASLLAGGRRKLRSYPALAAWRRRYADERRYRFDALWRAACAEMNAIEAEQNGLSETAKQYLREARDILRSALKGVA